MRSFTSFYNAEHCPDKSVEPSAPTLEEGVNKCCARAQKSVVCYTPKNSHDIVSCTSARNGDVLLFLNDPRAVTIPAGAIIDNVEFFGVAGFSTKDVFSIGLGQMNQDISFPLIVDADPAMANERAGGCRDFISVHPDGRNDKKIVLTNSYINVELGQPITSGYLQIIIRYHLKSV